MKTSAGRKSNKGLYVLSSLYPHVTGGMEIFNYYFLNYQLNKHPESIYYLTGNKAENNNGHFIPLKKIWPVRIFYPIQFFLVIWQLRKKIDFAYISHAQQSWIISYSQSLILRLFRKPYVITIHSGKQPDWKFSYPFISYFRHAVYVIGVSEPICSAFKRVIPKQSFHYVPPLIPFVHSLKSKHEIREQLGCNDREKILLYVGSLKGMKNPDKIVEAFRIMGNDFLEEHHIKMIFAGSGQMENSLKEQVAEYQLGRYIRFAGWVSREEIPDYYLAADAYIISSDWEGTSLSLLEAMFNKLAIIGSDAPGINRMVAHERNGLLYRTNDPEDLAKTIKRLFSDPALMDNLSGKALCDFKEKYSFESMMEKYDLVFSSFSK